MDPDMNKYDLNHRVVHHPKMSDAEWEDAYRAAWEAFYAPEHIRTILHRAAACRLGRPKTTLTTLLWFKLVGAYEGVHPLEGGAFRRKFRRDRRNGLPRENPVLFYPRYFGESAVKMWRYWSVYRQCKSILDAVLAAPDRWTTRISRSRRHETTNLRRSISTTRPPAAKPPSRASTVTMRSGSARTQLSGRLPRPVRQADGALGLTMPTGVLAIADDVIE